jgi:hypothetical protein
MTSRTRRRLQVCLILGLVALPVEALILPVAMTPDPAAAAVAFASAMSPEELQAAASQIDAYPATYRRAILQSLSPGQRADVWRTQMQSYLASHPNLTASQAAVVRDGLALVSPALLSGKLDASMRAEVSEVFARAQAELGPRAAKELFMMLGPTAPGRASALPLTQRLADSVRSWRASSAQGLSDCNCNMTMDTCDLVPEPWLECSQLYDCEIDTTWPMCGPFFCWACDGWCKIIGNPGGMGGKEGM